MFVYFIMRVFILIILCVLFISAKIIRPNTKANLLFKNCPNKAQDNLNLPSVNKSNIELVGMIFILRDSLMHPAHPANSLMSVLIDGFWLLLKCSDHLEHKSANAVPHPHCLSNLNGL